MILTELARYAANHLELPPRGYTKRAVQRRIHLTLAGELVENESLTTKEAKRGLVMSVPDLVRSNSIVPKLLADNGEYTFGISREGGDAGKVAERHRAYVELLEFVLEATASPEVEAVLAFLAGDPQVEFGEGETIVFAVEGQQVHSLPRVSAYWSALTENAVSNNPVMTCLVTGKEVAVVTTMPEKTKGIPGGQTSGVSLVSANSPAHWHFGNRQNLNAPLGADTATAVVKALNHLLRDPRHHLFMGDSVLVYWSTADTGTLQEMLEPEGDFFRAPYTGETFDSDQGDLFMLELSAHGSRAVVRNWSKTSLAELNANLDSWFAAQMVPGTTREKPYGVTALVASAYRSLSDAPPRTAFQLYRCALEGGAPPRPLLGAALERCRVEQKVPPARLALLQLLLGGYVSLEDLAGPDKRARLLGELFATLEEVQYAAVGGVNASITDRYLPRASAQPAQVFPNLLRLMNGHLRTLQTKGPGSHVLFERKVGAVLNQINENAPGEPFPRRLSQTQQGHFLMGYQLSRNKRFASIAAAKENK